MKKEDLGGDLKKPYRGVLTAAQVAAGINAARANSKRLLADAKLLYDHGRYASAASLAILSIEETGKEPVLHGLAAHELTGDKLSDSWKAYTSHKAKNEAWILPWRSAQNPSASMKELSLEVEDPTSYHTILLDSIKQAGFYSDCVGGCEWQMPEEAIDEELAMAMIATATALQGADRQRTEEEILELVEVVRNGTKEEDVEKWTQKHAGNTNNLFGKRDA